MTNELAGYKQKQAAKPNFKNLKKFYDWQGSWDSYLDYLNQHGAISPNLERTPQGWRLR